MKIHLQGRKYFSFQKKKKPTAKIHWALHVLQNEKDCQIWTRTHYPFLVSFPSTLDFSKCAFLSLISTCLNLKIFYWGTSLSVPPLSKIKQMAKRRGIFYLPQGAIQAANFMHFNELPSLSAEKKLYFKHWSFAQCCSKLLFNWVNHFIDLFSILLYNYFYGIDVNLHCKTTQG